MNAPTPTIPSFGSSNRKSALDCLETARRRRRISDLVEGCSPAMLSAIEGIMGIGIPHDAPKRFSEYGHYGENNPALPASRDPWSTV
jgi:hypothetical protein